MLWCCGGRRVACIKRRAAETAASTEGEGYFSSRLLCSQAESVVQKEVRDRSEKARSPTCEARALPNHSRSREQ
jgi:hypothetical protein